MLHTIQNNLTKEGEEMELKTRYQYTYFIYPYVNNVDQGAFGIATSPYTMDMIYNNL